MNKKSKILFSIASLMLVGVYFFPIWNINLNAPQYPEGIGLRIWINEITGMKEHDLNLINGLNHYIGMKEIIPESIPELKIMPYIIAFFIALGLLITLMNKRKLILAWLSLFVITLSAGLYDFYLWGYDYGHNLNPNAPIKVPGMTYQPPFIGTKQLLNMTAESIPGISSIIVFAAITIAAYAYWTSHKQMEGKYDAG